MTIKCAYELFGVFTAWLKIVSVILCTQMPFLDLHELKKEFEHFGAPWWDMEVTENITVT